jgi:hypothetical protein
MTATAFTGAWHLTGVFWKQTLSAFAHHPGIVLLYAAPVATERAWVQLRPQSVRAGWLPSLEALIMLWRLVMCFVAVWIVLTPAQVVALRASFASNVLIQDTLDSFGQKVARQLWLLSWEFVFYLAAFFLLAWLLSAMARLWARDLDIAADQKKNERLALAAAARNLLLAPLAMIYAAILICHVVTT